MKLLFSFFFALSSLSLLAQVDSVSMSDVYDVDTVIVADTTFVMDTIIVQDTMLVMRSMNDSEGDTLFLSSHQSSWSLIPDESLDDKKKIIVRKDSGIMLVSAKISFSDTSDDKDWDGYSIRNLPPIAIQAEYFHNDLFSYGGQLLYGRSKCTNDTLTTSYVKNSVVGLSTMGTFHYGSWLQDVTHNWFNLRYLDLYASVVLRFDVHRDVKEEYWNSDLSEIENQNETYVNMKVRPVLGARYYISDRFSINVELGKGNLGMLSSSVSWVILNSKE